MHTSTRLEASHFQYWSTSQEVNQALDFETFCPDYHEQDRVGMVSPCLEDGVRYTACALLALTTRFYDVQRSQGQDFFTYPQHFAIIDADPTSVATRLGRLSIPEGDARMHSWAWLDVWPASNWLYCGGSALAMLKTVFDFQINRLFWPQSLKAEAIEGGLPAYVRQLLQARLKSVYYYQTETPTIEIRAAQKAVELVNESIERLPPTLQNTLAPANTEADFAYRETFQQVSVDDFLTDLAFCFQEMEAA